jgi:hypothetical protein
MNQERKMSQKVKTFSSPSIAQYRRIMKEFLPYVLIRCTKYTSSKRLAEIIAVYVFASAYYRYLVGRMKSREEITRVLGMMVEIVGSNLSDGTGEEEPVCDCEFLQDEEKVTAAVIEYLMKQS